MSFPIVILGSGKGSNAEALLKSESSNKLGLAKVTALISDCEDAGILSLGQKYSVSSIYINPGNKNARLSNSAERVYIERILSFSPKLIILAGFMRIISKSFIDACKGRIINLHPSLLPSFPGSNAVQEAFNEGVKITGCTVHWVTAELDAGPIIDQKEVCIDEYDTLELLTKKIHAAEHKLLPDVVSRLSRTKYKTA